MFQKEVNQRACIIGFKTLALFKTQNWRSLKLHFVVKSFKVQHFIVMSLWCGEEEFFRLQVLNTISQFRKSPACREQLLWSLYTILYCGVPHFLKLTISCDIVIIVTKHRMVIPQGVL